MGNSPTHSREYKDQKVLTSSPCLQLKTVYTK